MTDNWLTDKREQKEYLESTLDYAEGAFKSDPSNKNAGSYLEALMEYEAEGMIGDDTFLNGLATLLDYLKGDAIDYIEPELEIKAEEKP